jgi:hypothetical protein
MQRQPWRHGRACERAGQLNGFPLVAGLSQPVALAVLARDQIWLRGWDAS